MSGAGGRVSGAAPLFFQLFCAPFAEPEREGKGRSPPGRREGWGGAEEGEGCRRGAEDPVLPVAARPGAGAERGRSGGKWRPRARRGAGLLRLAARIGPARD